MLIAEMIAKLEMIRKEHGNNVRVCCMNTEYDTHNEVMSIGVDDVDFGHEMTLDEAMASAKRVADYQELQDADRLERYKEIISRYAKGERMMCVNGDKADFKKAVILDF